MTPPAIEHCGVRCYLLLVAGWLLLAVGALLTPSPIPIGLLMVGSGLAVLLRYSGFVRERLRRLRGRFPSLSSRLTLLERRLGPKARQLLRQTRPVRKRTARVTGSDCRR